MTGSYLPQPFGQDVRLERERQNTALLDWERNVLLDLHRRKCDPLFAGIQESPFGLWFTHKAALLFRDKPIIGQVTDTMRHIDRELLPQLVTTHSTDPASFDLALRQMHSGVSRIQYLLDDAFDELLALESGKDTLTQLLNRRYLPAIFERQVAQALASRSSFAVLMIDIDHFKSVNDRWGHAAGDTVLRALAATIVSASRTSDIAFRYGGEEFLVLLPRTTAKEAHITGERIRTKIEQQAIATESETVVIPPEIS